MDSAIGSEAGDAGRVKAAGMAWLGAERVTSHSQQSLQRRHFSQRWLLHASLVQRAQMRVDSSPQMLQMKGIQDYFFLPDRAG
jgi:hypothetical protein